MSASTIAALSTAPGEAALAVVRASGPRVPEIVMHIAGTLPPPRHATRIALKNADGSVLDDSVLTWFQAPNSYTGEDVLELSLHGNPLIVSKALGLLQNLGCVPALPGEFTRRAFTNARMDLSQAEAVADLIHARSEAALAAAHRLLQGELGDRIRALSARLVESSAALEAYIDFPEEDLPPEDRNRHRESIQAVRDEAAALAANRRAGRLLRQGVRVVIAGPPNAGKSSLLNRVSGRARALVHDQPGTTRDYIEEPILVGRHRVLLIDTAGVRETDNPVEAAGVQLTQRQLAEADLIWWLQDASEPSTQALRMENETPYWLLVNKLDISSKPLHLEDSDTPSFGISAKTGLGIDTLLKRLERWIDDNVAAQGSEALAVNDRHAAALEETLRHLDTALARLGSGPPDVFLAGDIRHALEALGEIVGRIDHEEILDVLFQRFCIGK
jgi:tRNA modification GTPase